MPTVNKGFKSFQVTYHCGTCDTKDTLSKEAGTYSSMKRLGWTNTRLHGWRCPNCSYPNRKLKDFKCTDCGKPVLSPDGTMDDTHARC